MALTFTRRTIRLFTRAGFLVALVSWPAVWGLSHWLFVNRTAALERMRSEGRVVEAVPLSIDGSLGWQRRTYHYEIAYRFADAAGRSVTGRDSISVAPNSAARNSFEAMRDPAASSGIKPDARVEVMYLPADPGRNGLKLRYDMARVPEGSWGFMAGLGTAVIVAAIVIGVGTMMERRFRPD